MAHSEFLELFLLIKTASFKNVAIRVNCSSTRMGPAQQSKWIERECDYKKQALLSTEVIKPVKKQQQKTSVVCLPTR